jgi:hypothetical protein
MSHDDGEEGKGISGSRKKRTDSELGTLSGDRGVGLGNDRPLRWGVPRVKWEQE